MSDWTATTNDGGHAPATATAPGVNPYQQPAAGYRPPVIVGQGAAQPAAESAGRAAMPSRASTSVDQLRAGDKAQHLSLVFGVLGFITLPLIFGPLAIWQGNKAEALDRYGNAGRTLGWIATILGLIAIVGFVVLFMLLAQQNGVSASELLRRIALAYTNPEMVSQAGG